MENTDTDLFIFSIYYLALLCLVLHVFSVHLSLFHSVSLLRFSLHPPPRCPLSLCWLRAVVLLIWNCIKALSQGLSSISTT